MTDRYQEIRAALAMGPTPGPWAAHPDIGTPVGTLKIAPPIWGINTFNVPLIAAVYGTGVTQPANAALIAACDPDTIRELLAERDRLAAALEAAREVFYVVDVSLGGDANVIPVSMFDEPAIFASEDKAERFRDFANGTGRPHVVRKLTLHAIDQARGKGIVPDAPLRR